MYLSHLFFFHAAPAAQKLPLLSLASSNDIQKRQQSGQRTGRGVEMGGDAGFVLADVLPDEGL